MINLEIIYPEYKDKVFGYLLHRVNDEHLAEDLCSEVFLKVLKSAKTYDGEKSAVSTWIYNITRNTLYDYYRTRHEAVELEEEVPVSDDFVEEVCQDEMLEALADGLETLPSREREIILRHYYRGESLKDVGEQLGISYAYVRTLHQNALGKLKEFLEKQ